MITTEIGVGFDWGIYYSSLVAYIIKGSLVANFRYTNFWVAGQE